MVVVYVMRYRDDDYDDDDDGWLVKNKRAGSGRMILRNKGNKSIID